MPHFAHHFEENYLKALYKLHSRQDQKVNNTALARYLELNPATVLEMVRKMADKKLVQLLADKTIRLTDKGHRIALDIIRRHRLWEVFLVERLQYKWHEVHHLAEQLEHIESEDLVDRLDAFLGFPSTDPHGDPIPTKEGLVETTTVYPLLQAPPGKTLIVRSFADTQDSFLDYLASLQIMPGAKVKLISIHPYDQSCQVQLKKNILQLSEKVAQNILVQANN